MHPPGRALRAPAASARRLPPRACGSLDSGEPIPQNPATRTQLSVPTHTPFIAG